MQGVVKKRDEKGVGSRGQERGEGAWRSQCIQIGHGAPLRREGPRELFVVEPPADGRGTRVCSGGFCWNISANGQQHCIIRIEVAAQTCAVLLSRPIYLTIARHGHAENK